MSKSFSKSPSPKTIPHAIPLLKEAHTSIHRSLHNINHLSPTEAVELAVVSLEQLTEALMHLESAPKDSQTLVLIINSVKRAEANLIHLRGQLEREFSGSSPDNTLKDFLGLTIKSLARILILL